MTLTTRRAEAHEKEINKGSKHRTWDFLLFQCAKLMLWSRRRDVKENDEEAPWLESEIYKKMMQSYGLWRVSWLWCVASATP
jgi:hypothetical protein